MFEDLENYQPGDVVSAKDMRTLGTVTRVVRGIAADGGMVVDATGVLTRKRPRNVETIWGRLSGTAAGGFSFVQVAPGTNGVYVEVEGGYSTVAGSSGAAVSNRGTNTTMTAPTSPPTDVMLKRGFDPETGERVWGFEEPGSGAGWCKVTALNACGRSFTANPCKNAAGTDPDTSVELTVYTTSPADGQAPTHLALAVDDVVPYLTTADNVHYQVNPHQLQSFGYQCNTNRSSVGGTDYLADDFVLTTGNYGTTCAGVELGKVELNGTRFTTYGAAFDTRGKRVALGSSAPPTQAADTNTAHLVRWTLAGSTDEVVDSQCGAISIPGVTIDAYVPAVMLEGTEALCSTNRGKLFTLEFGDQFKISDMGDGRWKIEVRTEDKDVVTDPITCEDGTITYSTARVHSVISCTSGGL